MALLSGEDGGSINSEDGGAIPPALPACQSMWFLLEQDNQGGPVNWRT